MQDTKNNSLLEFMRSNLNSKYVIKNSYLKVKKKDNFDEDEEIKKKQEIKNIKNESNYKASRYNKFEMYKRLIINTLIGYLAVIIFAIFLVIFITKLAPAIISLFNILLHKFIMSSLS